MYVLLITMATGWSRLYCTQPYNYHLDEECQLDEVHHHLLCRSAKQNKRKLYWIYHFATPLNFKKIVLVLQDASACESSKYHTKPITRSDDLTSKVILGLNLLSHHFHNYVINSNFFSLLIIYHIRIMA